MITSFYNTYSVRTEELDLFYYKDLVITNEGLEHYNISILGRFGPMTVDRNTLIGIQREYNNYKMGTRSPIISIYPTNPYNNYNKFNSGGLDKQEVKLNKKLLLI